MKPKSKRRSLLRKTAVLCSLLPTAGAVQLPSAGSVSAAAQDGMDKYGITFAHTDCLLTDVDGSHGKTICQAARTVSLCRLSFPIDETLLFCYNIFISFSLAVMR